MYVLNSDTSTKCNSYWRPGITYISGHILRLSNILKP